MELEYEEPIEVWELLSGSMNAPPRDDTVFKFSLAGYAASLLFSACLDSMPWWIWVFWFVILALQSFACLFLLLTPEDYRVKSFYTAWRKEAIQARGWLKQWPDGLEAKLERHIRVLQARRESGEPTEKEAFAVDLLRAQRGRKSVFLTTALDEVL
jgi:hypothetical protein